jgi:hypothetical protein
MPMASAFFSLQALHDVVDRLLDAEVVNGVAVVGQDDVDEVFADVVHVALDGGQHDFALGLALDFFHVRLEMSHRRLHRLGALQHERQLHLPGAEQIADDFHPFQQNVVDDLQRLVFLHRLIEMFDQIALLAVDDVLLSFSSIGHLIILSFWPAVVRQPSGKSDKMRQRIETLAPRS